MRLVLLFLISFVLTFAYETNDNRSISLKVKTFSWNTNWNKRIINYNELLSGGPSRDGIPPIDKPKFETINSAKKMVKR